MKRTQFATVLGDSSITQVNLYKKKTMRYQLTVILVNLSTTTAVLLKQKFLLATPFDFQTMQFANKLLRQYFCYIAVLIHICSKFVFPQKIKSGGLCETKFC